MAALLLLPGCERLAESEGIKPDFVPAAERPRTEGSMPAAADADAAAAGDGDAAAQPAAPEYRIYRGSGQFIRGESDTPATIHVGDNGDITLDFADADIRQVVKATLGDILGLNYVIAPEVQGTVTAQTERPLSRDALLPALESILRLHGAALVLDGALYRVETLQGASRSQRSVRLQAGESGAGFGVQVVQLRYIGAEDMRNTLAPLAGQEAILHVDRTRNLLILAGAQPELAALLDTVRVFDVNWLSGMSFGLFPLEFAEPDTLIEELRLILDTDQGGALSGLVRLMPVERMNAVLAVSQQPRYLDEVRRWVQRLDRGTQTASDRQLFIYFVQNAKATDLAEVLNQVFGEQGGAARGAGPGVVAPGLEPVEIASTPSQQPPAPGGDQPAGQTPPQAGLSAPQRPAAPPQPGTISLTSSETVRIVADEYRNALLISGSPAEYRAVLRALHQLDRRPLEVLVEVTIADVVLSDRLEYGIRWFLQSSDGKHSGGFTDLTADTVLEGVAPTLPGLNYVFTSTNAKAVLDLLSSVTTLNVISAPQVMVLNNQEALLQVGDQVPVLTGESTTDGGVITNTVDLKDTGVILTVTPRVNEGGLIIMDIEQEVSQVNEDASAGELTPTISKRIINTTAAVQSGQTVALGGLIQDNKSNSKVGVPGLSKIPFVGALFRYTTDTITRSELLVLVSPRIVRNAREAREITDELRRRMEELERLEAKIQPKPADGQPSR